MSQPNRSMCARGRTAQATCSRRSAAAPRAQVWENAPVRRLVVAGAALGGLLNLGESLNAGCADSSRAQPLPRSMTMDLGADRPRHDLAASTAGTGDGSTAPQSSAAEAAQSPLSEDPSLPPDRRALLLVQGQERIVDAALAQAQGYTIVDLSDAWTPYIFRILKNEQGIDRNNRYRRIFIGLAADQLDDDGQPLEPGEKNYLELFGIPPALSVLRARFVEDAAKTCEAEINLALLAEAKSVLPHTQPVKRGDAERRAADQATLLEAEKRLLCEGLVDARARHRRGVYDDGLRDILKRFQQKHMIYEAPYLQKKTLSVLARRMIDNNFETLRRVMAERVASAAAIVEDGSSDGKNGPAQYRSKTGTLLPVRNLIDEYTAATLEQLGLTDADKAQRFFARHPASDFQWLRVAVKLPPLPEYYSEHMSLSVVVDRGDVWYELPYDEKGRSVSQPRQAYPSFTLHVDYDGQKIPLVRWRTTIGGWRSEQAADGYEYYRYKGSDVGPRVIRTISAGPVWVAPETTPLRTLVKQKRVNGTTQTVVNYDEIGPGFRSAYGLVVGYFVTPGERGKPDVDNGIRAHGSADYLSIGSSDGFSHGCHRLLNHNAVRLYSFMLNHRWHKVLGDQPLGVERRFLYRDAVYDLRIPSRGFSFRLVPPIHVSVLQGKIRGERKVPFVEYVPKPGVVYPGPPPDASKAPAADDLASSDGTTDLP